MKLVIIVISYRKEVLPFAKVLVDNFTQIKHYFKAIRNPIKVARHFVITAFSW